MQPLSRAFQEQVRREALTIRTDAVLGMVYPDRRPPQELALIWVDASKKPEVAKLWREHEEHGEGDHETRWVYLLDFVKPEATVFYLDIQVRIPGRRLVRYFVACPVAQQIELLERLVKAPQFGIMTEPWPRWKEWQDDDGVLQVTPEMLPLLRRGTMYESPDGQELASMLAQWRELVA